MVGGGVEPSLALGVAVEVDVVVALVTDEAVRCAADDVDVVRRDDGGGTLRRRLEDDITTTKGSTAEGPWIWLN